MTDVAHTVCEGPDGDVDDVAHELREAGWTITTGFAVTGGVPAGARIACVGEVANSDDASSAVLAAVRGAIVVVRARAPREVIDALCEDLRRLGPLDHFTVPRPKPVLDDDQRRLLTILLDGHTLGDAATQLHLSRRTADRRLAAARAALGVSSTAEALVSARRRGLV